jgi:phosphatidate cytidylyltransferase
MNHLALASPGTVAVSAGIGILLLVATAWVGILHRRKPGPGTKELVLRVRGWWVICALFLGAILAGGRAGVLLFGFISYLAFKEYVSLIPFRRVDRRALFWAYVAIPAQYAFIWIGWYGMFTIFIPVYLFLIVPMRLVSLQETKGFLATVGMIHWGLMITVFCLGHAAWLFVQPLKGFEGQVNGGLVLFLVGLTEVNDIAQFVWGKTLGRTKILPGVSPGKTWAGLWGGVGTTALLAGALAPLLTPLPVPVALLIGTGIALFGFMGDVTVSALKRDLGIKDSGGLLPGHGGILDRIDSLMFTAPLFVHFIRFYYA